MGKKTGRPDNWTEEQIEILKECYPESSWTIILQKLPEFTKSQICSKASRCNIERTVYSKTVRSQDQEIQFILTNYQSMTAAEMAHALNRPHIFIDRILKRYNLQAKCRAPLKKEEVELFKELYPKYTNKYLHNKYFPDLTPSQLRQKAKNFGLVKNKDKSIKWYDKEQILEDLENAIKEHGRVPMIVELQNWGLPSDKTFSRYFGSFTKACEEIGVERPCYSKVLFSDGVFYDLNNNCCLSRTELLISNFLIENNFNIEKEYYYNNIIPVEECGNKRFDWKIGDKYIEFFGLEGYREYSKNSKKKIQLCEKYNVSLLALYTPDITNMTWKNKILTFLNE